MNVYLNDVEVFLDGDQLPAFTLSLSDLLDPSSIRGTRSSTIRILNTPESRAILGSEAMMWNGADSRPTIAFKEGGATVFTADVIVMRADRNVYEVAAIGGNASWFDWAKKTKLREFAFGNSEIIDTAYMTGTWGDEDEMLYFGLFNTGSIFQRPNTYDVPPEKLRPCVRVHRALRDAFLSIEHRINPKGALASVWKKFLMFHPTDELSRAIPSVYVSTGYVSGPAGWQSGSYFVPLATVIGTVELVDYLVGYDPFEVAFDGATLTAIVYDFTDQRVLAELVLPLAELGGSITVDHLFTNVQFIAGHQIGTAVQMFDMPGPLVIGTGGPVTRIRYSDGVDTLELQPLTVQDVDLSDASQTGTFVTGSRMSIAAAMPDLTVMDLLKAMINAQRLVAITDPLTKTIDLYFEDEFLRPNVSATDIRTVTDRIDHTLAPSKIAEQQPSSLLLKWKDDSSDRLLKKLDKVVGGTIGYGNGLATIERGTKPQQTVEVPFAATAMGKVFVSMLVPSMLKIGGTLQEDDYDFEDRLLIDGGMRAGDWKLDGVNQTEYPYAYFANDTPNGHMLPFDNAAMFGDTRQGLLYSNWAKRIAIMRDSNIFEGSTFWHDHELATFDFGMPTLLNDGHSDGGYYVQEIKDHRFGRVGPTRTIYVQAPQAASPAVPVITYCAGGVRVSGAGTEEVNGVYCPDGTENDAPVWTKMGGVRLEESIYFPLYEGEPVGYFALTSGGTFEDDPNNAPYVTYDTPGDPGGTWVVNTGFGGGGDLPVPTAGPV